LWVIPLALLLPAIVTADFRGTPSLFRHRVMVKLGELSLSFYLTHATVMYLLLITLGRSFRGTGKGVLLLAISMLAAISVAWVVHVLWERPIMRRFGKPGPRPRAPRPGDLVRRTQVGAVQAAGASGESEASC